MAAMIAALDGESMTTLERALALLWWAGRDDPASGLSAAEICSALEQAGHPKQNVTRLDRRLTEDRRATRASGAKWRLHPTARRELETRYAGLRTGRPALPPTDSVLPRELLAGTRGYLERVCYQVNASYDAALFDCCAVMCRRVLETLIIEAYERGGRAQEIKGSDGNFLMFAGLLSYFERDQAFHPSRNALIALREFKTLGDLSAHNRRFNARADDIDRIRDGLRVAVEELVHMAGLTANAAG